MKPKEVAVIRLFRRWGSGITYYAKVAGARLPVPLELQQREGATVATLTDPTAGMRES
jgi:hypothetical protein